LYFAQLAVKTGSYKHTMNYSLQKYAVLSVS